MGIRRSSSARKKKNAAWSLAGFRAEAAPELLSYDLAPWLRPPSASLDLWEVGPGVRSPDPSTSVDSRKSEPPEVTGAPAGALRRQAC